MLKPTRFLAIGVASLVMLAPLPVAAAPMIKVGSYTPSTTGPFVVPITITGAVDLSSWLFSLNFDTTDLQINTDCKNDGSDTFCDPVFGPVTQGPFFSSVATFPPFFDPGFIFNDLGLLDTVAGAWQDPPPGPSGDGILAYVEFITTANGTGDSTISVTGHTTSSVPEPATLALLAGGLAALLGVRRRTRRQEIQEL